MNKPVVIHAGPGKTGTSAIQFWLNSNRQLLEKNGVWYPKHAHDVNNVSSGNLDTVFEYDKNRKKVLSLSKVKSLLSKFEASEHKQLLLSSEFFFLHIEELIQIIPNVKFIVYLRNPLELIESNYNQGVKRKQTIKSLHVPQTLNFKVINFISRLINDYPAVQIAIRPYEKSLFVGGDIVNDLLSAIDLKPQFVNNLIVNSSYSLQALEFKRIANHFDLGHADMQLDRVLQSYGEGYFNYSLMHPKRFESLKLSVLSQLDSFISLHQFDHLQDFRDSIAQGKQRVVKQQGINAQEIADIFKYIQRVQPELFNTLKKLAAIQNRFILPNHAYYEFFDVECPQRIDAESYKTLQTMSTKLCLEGGHNVDVLREIALSLGKTGHKEASLLFMEAAHKLAPNRPFIRNEINKHYVVDGSRNVTRLSFTERCKQWFLKRYSQFNS
ncbi:hypothetical protein MK852_17140 [Shewanella benthica]|uniref:hypothetical protein n=1 Tax=Shewanella benthica TaxID=43661 RepID=UPI0018799C23|nr:hypothetical protein [Shewanella benthica]MBE7213951.1 hypothetical protein [Shewanella benthica]MCL1063840.1 hypothetical protein [Shewanella benthica]